MLKKVKQKQYKTKQEFKDDLDLIWQNCFTYNAAEVSLHTHRCILHFSRAAQHHPLRQCAKRLQFKAQKLLKNITDRKERTDPSIPPALGGSLRINGLVNGHSHRYPLSIKSGTTVIRLSAKQRQDIPFSDMPAITRTPAAMSTFLQLDQDLNRNRVGSKTVLPTEAHDPNLVRKLKELALPLEDEIDSDDADSPGSIESVGEKRKL